MLLKNLLLINENIIRLTSEKGKFEDGAQFAPRLTAPGIYATVLKIRISFRAVHGYGGIVWHIMN